MPANVKISQLPVVTTLGPTDVLPVVASGVTSQISEASLANVIAQSITGSEVLSVLGTSIYSSGSVVGTSVFSTSSGIFIGYQAGNSAQNAAQSTFIGYDAGLNDTNASGSNFIGYEAGYNATNAAYSNFIGYALGSGATNAAYSNFIGYGIGSFAANASYSTIIGYNAGNNGGGSIGTNNIIIGKQITLPNNYNNGVNIGGLIFGSGSYPGPGFAASSGSANGAVGINQPNPAYSLDVSGSIHLSQALLLQPQVPLPTGTTGSLAASGSHLYFYNGTSSNAGWAQVI
jgi:hypothetical protein